MMQIDLVIPLARRDDPATSHSAAQKAASVAPTHRNIIAAALREHGPLTVYGIEAATGLPAHKAGKRLVELQRLGIAEPLDEEIAGCRLWRALGP